jgi:hypothetical protein
VLYTSDSDKMMRYTDEVCDYIMGYFQYITDLCFMEGETMELCRWTVNLNSLPTFQHNASIPQPNGFFTGLWL